MAWVAVTGGSGTGLPTGWMRVLWGGVALVVCLACAGWAWLSRSVADDHAADAGGDIFGFQALLSQLFAVVAGIIGVVWCVQGLAQVGVPAWVPLLGFAAAAGLAVWAVLRHRRTTAG